jgi:transcription elongation factor Elf1
MYTVCPQCNKVYPISSGRKRRKSSVYCKNCDKKFKVTEVLQEHPLGLISEAKAEIIVKTAAEATPKAEKKLRQPKELETPQISPLLGLQSHDDSIEQEAEIPGEPARMPWELDQAPVSRKWLHGAALGFFILAAQLIYFEWDDWSQNRLYRPYLEGICGKMGCFVPVYRNLGEFEVNQGGLTTTADNTLTFKAVISNHAVYPQPLPKIRLKLVDYNEIVFAERIFTPKDYRMTIKSIDETVPAEETFAVHLHLAKPVTPVGGYTFDLVD